MKMDSLGKTSSSATSSARSSATGGGRGGRPSSSYLDSAHAYADTFKVEFQNSTREMAVDVPDSFIAQIKTPPKYPPPPSMQQRSSTLPASASTSASLNGSSSYSPPPPMLSARDHLRIEQDGHLLNTLPGPKLPPGGNKWVQPNKEQSLRIQKYSNDLTKKSLEAERKQRENQLLRQSIRTSQKMNRLKEQQQQQQHHHLLNHQGVENGAFEQEQEHVQHVQFKDPGQILNVINNVETLCANAASNSNSSSSSPAAAAVAAEARSTAAAVSPMLKSLVHSQDFQKALKVYSTVSHHKETATW